MSTHAREPLRFAYVDIHGTTRPVVAAVGDTLMQAAVNHVIDGIPADCGGNCACATCHVVLPAALAATLPAPQADESDLLAFSGHALNPQLRLGCQVRITPGFEGIVVAVAGTA